MNAKLTLCEQNWPRYSWAWEMRTVGVYLRGKSDDGYTTKANAKRAALREAERFGLVVVDVECED